MVNFVDFIRKKHHYGRYEIVKQLIKNKGKKLLDIGCGAPANCMQEGSFLRYIGYGQGIDIEARKIPFKFDLGSITSIPHKDKQFEVVTAIEVIEHINDPLLAFEEIHRVLKNKGTFVMSTPDNNLYFKIFWWFWENTLGKEWHSTHLTAYKREEWLSIIKKTGYFRIKKVIDYWGINTIVQMEKI